MFLCNAGDKGSNFALWAEYHHSTCAKRAFSVIDHRIWELHIEDYLQMVSAEQKEYAEVFDYSKITEKSGVITDYWTNNLVLSFHHFCGLQSTRPLPLNHLTLAKGLLISHTWQYLYTKLDEFMEHHNDDVEDQDEQIMGILEYLTEWLINHILYVDAQIPQG